jgi:hypothetical protein
VAWLALVGAVASTACGPQISDTGYTGTWSKKGSNTQTTVAIVRDGEGYLFRWGRDSVDGRLKVRCDWEGNCEETFDGASTGRYKMRTWINEENGRLRVECRGTQLDHAGNTVELHYVDELLVRANGMRLVSRLVERDGTELEGRGHGRRVFDKISDTVIDPPPSRGPHE